MKKNLGLYLRSFDWIPINTLLTNKYKNKKWNGVRLYSIAFVKLNFLVHAKLLRLLH